MKLSEEEMRHVRGDLYDLPGAHDIAKSRLYGWESDIRGYYAAPESGQAAAREKSIEMLRLVGIPSPEQRDDYPHQMSGGMRQRDDCHGFILQSQAFDCGRTHNRPGRNHSGPDSGPNGPAAGRARHSNMMITHDLGVIAEVVEKVIVMYTGKIVEAADTYTILGTLASIQSAFSIDSASGQHGSRLQAIPGSVPIPGTFPGWLPPPLRAAKTSV